MPYPQISVYVLTSIVLKGELKEIDVLKDSYE